MKKTGDSKVKEKDHGLCLIRDHNAALPQYLKALDIIGACDELQVKDEGVSQGVDLEAAIRSNVALCKREQSSGLT